MIVVFIFLIFSVVNCQIGIEQCKTRNGYPGTCKSYQNCPKAIEDNNRGVQVTFCPNYSRNLICCVEQRKVYSDAAQPVQLPFQANKSSKRISEIKCEEYANSVKRFDIVQSLTASGGTQKIEYWCEQQNIGLITGGVKASLAEFPHMAALGYPQLNDPYSYEFNCGGSLISNNFVLTAAHCKSNRHRLEVQIVRLGALNLSPRNDQNYKRDVRVQRFIIHDYNSFKKKNDIALIQLAEHVSFNNYIRPACLSVKTTLPSIATVIGYGSTVSGGPYTPSEDLLKASVQVRNLQICQDLFKDTDYDFDSSQICAGKLNSNGVGEDTCQGDSGGPIEFLGQDKSLCTHFVFGITSFGPTAACGKAPGIYTKVSHYLDWIESHVWPQQ